MTQYIDKSAVVAEIEKRMQELRPTNTHKMQVGEKMDRDVLMWLNALTWVKKILDTIEVKDVDLVEEFADFLEKENAYVDDNNVISYYNGSSFNHTCDIYPIAKHFYELGLKAQKGE